MRRCRGSLWIVARRVITEKGTGEGEKRGYSRQGERARLAMARQCSEAFFPSFAQLDLPNPFGLENLRSSEAPGWMRV